MAGERDQAYLPACLAYGGKALSMVVARSKSTSFPLELLSKRVFGVVEGKFSKIGFGGGGGKGDRRSHIIKITST